MEHTNTLAKVLMYDLSCRARNTREGERPGGGEVRTREGCRRAGEMENQTEEEEKEEHNEEDQTEAEKRAKNVEAELAEPEDCQGDEGKGSSKDVKKEKKRPHRRT